MTLNNISEKSDKKEKKLKTQQSIKTQLKKSRLEDYAVFLHPSSLDVISCISSQVNYSVEVTVCKTAKEEHNRSL